MLPVLNPPPTSLPISSLWVIPVHQPQASCILRRTSTGDSFLIWYYTYFNAILPNHPHPPSPIEPKRLFYTTVSLLLSHIQGYHYHLSKFHIYWLLCGSDSKASVYNVRDLGSIPGLGRFPGEGNGNPLQYFLPWKCHGRRSLVQAIIHGVAKSRAWLSNFTFTFTNVT